MTTTAKLKGLIKKHGLAAREAEILNMAGEALELVTTPAPRKLRAGVTKFGGDPDLPPATPWPRRGRRPLMFIAQVNLKEIAAAESDPVWPQRDGLLSFFYDAAEQPWGISPAERNAWRIIYTPPRTRLEPRPVPKEAGRGSYPTDPIPQCSVSFRKVITIPPGDNLLVFNVLPRTSDQKRYNDLVLEFADPLGKHRHQWGGWPVVIQDDMELNCQFAWHGIEDPFGQENWDGRGEPKLDPRVPLLAAGATRWMLLLQVASDDNLGINFGDEGNIYFYATAETIATGEFKEVWLELQCT